MGIFGMDMILLDWTRMGRSYCLAGAVVEGTQIRIVRPLLSRHRNSDERRAGWSPYLLDGYSRWELFELIGAQAAVAEPPHLEDLWVRTLQPRGRSAPSDLRQAILNATLVPPNEALFGASLVATRAAAYLVPGSGRRSLATLIVSPGQVAFAASWRDGSQEPDFRVEMPLPDLGTRTMPVKDYHLLRRIEYNSPDLERSVERLNHLIRDMGENIAVRLGLSRPFQGAVSGSAVCWLMADGFFSCSDPQP
jgi:hypothetical protein